MFLVIGLLACGESATFEEAPPNEAPAEAEVPSKDDLPVVTPVDARPDEVVVQEAKGAPPPAGQPWPPIVVPEGARERDWEWDMKWSGETKKQNGENQPLPYMDPEELSEKMRDFEDASVKSGSDVTP